jgi:hypothetical protein
MHIRKIGKATLMVARKAIVEVDKVQGTQFPPEIQFEGSSYSLHSIYLDAGVDLDVRPDNDSIPDLAGPDNVYSDSELHNLMTSNRNPLLKKPKKTMSAYMVIVGGVYQTNGVLGIMFDSMERTGCAIFYGHSMIQSDPRAFLRTAAHELGHEFNLHHEDGTTFQESSVTKFTIMNQTWLITPWPQAIGYKFGDHEKIHLSHHNKKNVRPGGSPFYDCNVEHSQWHGGIT